MLLFDDANMMSQILIMLVFYVNLEKNYQLNGNDQGLFDIQRQYDTKNYTNYTNNNLAGLGFITWLRMQRKVQNLKEGYKKKQIKIVLPGNQQHCYQAEKPKNTLKTP